MTKAKREAEEEWDGLVAEKEVPVKKSLMTAEEESELAEMMEDTE